ncbi:MAG: hypothetical protein IKU03_04990 [Bacteroidales bacterium]|nr:hypothetical protein [Bacteroidales bacterium]
MNRGKRTCEILKEVRQRVARENDIPLETRECTHEGDCRGTCPYCEHEVRYLEQELAKRRSLGKAVTVAGIAVSALMMSGCHHQQTPDTAPEESTSSEMTTEAATPQVTEDSTDQEVPPAPGQSEFPYPDGEVLLGLFEPIDEPSDTIPSDTSSDSELWVEEGEPIES